MQPESMILQVAAAAVGLCAGTFLFSRVGSWIEAIVTALRAPEGRVALAARLNSGPWLLAGMLYWAWYVLSGPHAAEWDWFFGAVAAAVPVWLVVSIYLHRRARRVA